MDSDEQSGGGAAAPYGPGAVPPPPAGYPPAGTRPVDDGFAPQSPPPYDSGGYQWVPAPPSGGTPESGFRRALSSRRAGWVVSAVLACVIVGLVVALATAPATTPAASPSHLPTAGGGFTPGAGGFAGRFGGGAAGTVDTVSASSFTMTTRSGERYSVDEQSSTTYRSGTSAASQSAVTAGARVFVIGSTSGSTIKATEVTVLPSGGGGFGFPSG